MVLNGYCTILFTHQIYINIIRESYLVLDHACKVIALLRAVYTYVFPSNYLSDFLSDTKIERKSHDFASDSASDSLSDFCHAGDKGPFYECVSRNLLLPAIFNSSTILRIGADWCRTGNLTDSWMRDCMCRRPLMMRPSKIHFKLSLCENIDIIK
jgi:hypothetical protein